MGSYDEIIALADQLGVPSSRIPRLSIEGLNTIAEFITVMNEVRRVACQLEADRKVTMSRACCIIRELYETLLIMCGDLSNNDRGFYRDQEEERGLSLQGEKDIAQSHPSIANIASADQERNAARKIRLRKTHAKTLSRELSEAMHTGLGHIWKEVSSTAAMWRSATSFEVGEEDGIDISPDYPQPRRVLLYHISAMLDANGFQLEFFYPSPLSRDAYIQFLPRAAVREVIELNSSMDALSSQLEVLYGILHVSMLCEIKEHGRREPNIAHNYWNDLNTNPGIVSPVPFKMVAKACLAAQTSSASA